MERIAIFVDDAAHAQQLLAPLLAEGTPQAHWVIVGCAPRLTHRIGKWVAHSSREQWREHWARALRDKLEPLFRGHEVAACEWIVARGPLDRLSARLRGRLGAELRLLDLRRPKLGVDLAPVAAGQVPENRWATPVAVTSSLAAVLALTD